MSHQLPRTGRVVAQMFNDLLFQRACAGADRINLSTGNPSFAAYPAALQAAYDSLTNPNVRMYATGAGYSKELQQLIPFCEKSGIQGPSSGLSAENFVYGLGITHLYDTALSVLRSRFSRAYPGKQPVVLMGSPGYGLSTLQPEQHGYEVATFPLSQDKGWNVEADVIEREIKAIEADGTRKVVLYSHVNPHNPTGSVAGEPAIQALARVLKSHDVFTLDDQAYYGLEYGEKPVPLASQDFSQTLTLFSCSKAFGLPRVRAGFACGPASLIAEMNDHIAMQMVSLPTITGPVVNACYGEDQSDDVAAYLEKNKQGYSSSLRLLKAVVGGLGAVDLTSAEQAHIQKTCSEALGDQRTALALLKNGIPDFEFLNPDMGSGYFAMLRVKGLDQHFYGTTRLQNSFQFAAAVVDIGETLALPLSCCVSAEHPDTLRVTFAGMSDRRIVKGLYGFVKTLQTLTSAPDLSLQKTLETQGLALDNRYLLG